jgi:hypothetical protein
MNVENQCGTDSSDPVAAVKRNLTGLSRQIIFLRVTYLWTLWAENRMLVARKSRSRVAPRILKQFPTGLLTSWR